jgi:hypothetical protein
VTDAPVSKEIDRARLGLSKSLMSSPCERKSAYGEWVRDDAGRRLDFAMPERVTFGSAVDEAVAFILFHELNGSAYKPADAVKVGIKSVRNKKGWALIEDPATFRVQVENAVTLYLRPHEAQDPENARARVVADDGLARILALRDENIRLQGDNGRTLRAAPDLIGTPDIITDRRVIDVKTSGKRYSETKFRQSPEMPVYAELYASEFGVLPEFLAYQVYVRVAKPYWQWIEVPASSRHIELSRIHAARWRKGLATKDIDLFAFDPAFCGDCQWAQPIPEVAFEGCPVGLLINEEAAA